MPLLWPKQKAVNGTIAAPALYIHATLSRVSISSMEAGGGGDCAILDIAAADDDDTFCPVCYGYSGLVCLQRCCVELVVVVQQRNRSL